jgi:sugar lactone lactonase YvrE
MGVYRKLMQRIVEMNISNISVYFALTLLLVSVSQAVGDKSPLYCSVPLTGEVFTTLIEGPVVDKQQNVYAVGFESSNGVGVADKTGNVKLYVNLPDAGTPNALYIDKKGYMYFVDYTNHKIWKMNMSTREFSVMAENKNMNQPNDIAFTSKGYAFASDPNWGNSSGNLWRISPDGKTTCLESNMGTTNGIEVSPDEKILYVAESVQRNIWAYDINSKGDISNKRLLINFSADSSDGMKCDIRGNLYLTRQGRGCIAMISPQGKLLREIKLINKTPTNICFGGRDGKTAYVTCVTNDGKHGQIETFRTEFAGRKCR